MGEPTHVEFIGGPFDGEHRMVHEGSWIVFPVQGGGEHRYEIVRGSEHLPRYGRAVYRGLADATGGSDAEDETDGS